MSDVMFSVGDKIWWEDELLYQYTGTVHEVHEDYIKIFGVQRIKYKKFSLSIFDCPLKDIKWKKY